MNGARSSRTTGRFVRTHIKSGTPLRLLRGAMGKERPECSLPLGGAPDCLEFPDRALPICGSPDAPRASRRLLQLVGKNSNHPDTLFYNNDWNNIGPAFGLSWSLPWGGKEKTVLRAGYGISYQGAASFNSWLNLFTGNNPGLSYTQNFATLGVGATFFNFSSPNLPIPIPAPTTVKPLSQEPFDVRTNALLGFDDHRVNPYVQNFTLEIQRELLPRT